MKQNPEDDQRSSELTKSKDSQEQNIKTLMESEEQLRLVFEHTLELIVVAQDEKTKYN